MYTYRKLEVSRQRVRLWLRQPDGAPLPALPLLPLRTHPPAASPSTAQEICQSSISQLPLQGPKRPTPLTVSIAYSTIKGTVGAAALATAKVVLAMSPPPVVVEFYPNHQGGHPTVSAKVGAMHHGSHFLAMPSGDSRCEWPGRPVDKSASQMGWSAGHLQF